MRKLFVALTVLVLTLAGSTSLAMAAPPVDPEINSIARVQISALTVSLIIGMIIPIIVGLVTKLSTSSGVKAIVMLVLNAIQAFIVQSTMADGTAIFDKSTFVAFLLSLISSVAMYSGVYKPLNLTSSTPDGKLAPTKGLL